MPSDGFGEACATDVSCWKALNREMMRRMMTKIKGNVARMAPVWRPLSPPDQSRMAAERDWIAPQVNLTRLEGFRLPLVVNVPRTNVAESAEVIKNVPMRNMAMRDMAVPAG